MLLAEPDSCSFHEAVVCDFNQDYFSLAGIAA